MTANADGTVLMGYSAGASVTTGNGNTMVGYIAGTDITTGGGNTIIGYQALTNAQTDVSNSTVIGWKAGQKLGDDGGSDHSEHNIIIGAGTMDGGHDTLANNTAHFNVAIGNNAMGGDTGTSTSLTANTNVAIGHDSMRLISSGVNNVGVGYDALENITVGERNTAVGKGTLDLVTTGDFNTAIGYGCDPSSDDGQNQTMLGYNITGKGDNTVTLGNSDVTDVYMAQDGFAKVNAGAMHISSSTANYSSTSASLHIEGSGSSVVEVDGTLGRLFTVTDELSGSIFSANTIAGIPVIEATSAYEVKLDPFGNGKTIFGSDMSGSATSTGSFGRVNAITGFFEAGSKISDYVFEDDYNLRTIKEVEIHISQSKHLPGVPSEANIQEWREMSMGDRDRLLLEKIEELTLYTIQQDKQIQELFEEIKELKKNI